MTPALEIRVSADKKVRPWARLVFLSAIGFLVALRATAQADHQRTNQILYYIPHTHWEGAVFKTREEYLEMGLMNILKAVQLLKQYPEYKFTLDQVAYFKPFLERYPEEAAAVTVAQSAVGSTTVQQEAIGGHLQVKRRAASDVGIL